MSPRTAEVFLDIDMRSAAFPMYHQLANVLVRWDGKVLLLHRLTDPFKGYWSAPGGGIEPGEQYVETACRELREETGIETTSLEPMQVFVDHAHRLESHIYQYVSRDGGFTNAEPNEHDAIAWWEIGAALVLRLTPGISQTLQDVS